MSSQHDPRGPTGVEQPRRSTVSLDRTALDGTALDRIATGHELPGEVAR